MTTRRCVQRTFLLRPDPKLVQSYLYLLAVFSERYSIAVHAVVLMSSHEHLIATDTRGRMPDFLRDFHRMVALSTKELRQWEGNVWESRPTSRVALCTPKAVIEKLAYIMANPVEAGLVDQAEQWPGVMVLPEELGYKTWTIERPEFFLEPDNRQWPKTATLRLSPPPSHLRAEEVRARVRRELELLQARARERVRAKRWRVLGCIGVLQASPYQRARSSEPARRLNPNFAVGRGEKLAYYRAVQALREFRFKYREALEQWRQGIRDVLFPRHTWQMSWLHSVQLEPG
jgi:REP element-mobilizing transposase RayT